MNEATRLDQIQQLTRYFECNAEDLAGQTLQELLEEADRNHGEAVVYWGCWSADDLAQVLVPLT